MWLTQCTAKFKDRSAAVENTQSVVRLFLWFLRRQQVYFILCFHLRKSAHFCDRKALIFFARAWASSWLTPPSSTRRWMKKPVRACTFLVVSWGKGMVFPFESALLESVPVTLRCLSVSLPHIAVAASFTNLLSEACFRSASHCECGRRTPCPMSTCRIEEHDFKHTFMCLATRQIGHFPC